MTEQRKERPVFYDATGKRWRRTKSALLVTGFVVVAALLSFVPKMLADVPVSPYVLGRSAVPPPANDSDRSPASIAYGIDRTKMPVIGEGPLLRVIKLEGPHDSKTALDPFNDTPLRQLSQEESWSVEDYDYAVERYGQSNNKRIALTFDDGPDPLHTPEVLDLLSEYEAPSTFFVLGSRVTKFPEITKRMDREGHVVANHTFTHADFDYVSEERAEEEINQTQRIIRSTIGRNPSYFRVPYGGSAKESAQDTMRGILQTQKMGYIAASYQFDTNDWQHGVGDTFVFPELDGSDIVMLLHDAGGDRAYTMDYLREFIPQAKAAGYTFTTIDGLYPQSPALNATVSPGIADYMSLGVANAVVVWPGSIIRWLFIVTVGFLVFGLLFKIVLATLFVTRTHYPRRKRGYTPLVSVIIPAYNEETVLKHTVLSLLRSRYRHFEIVIIDDGSSDGTWSVVDELRSHRKVVGVRQANSGKSVAVNHGLRLARGAIVVSIDADTVFTPKTLGKLVRHFANPDVGAVAGVVKVGNVRNYLSRWQALEYITGINIERSAQAYLGAIMIAPGACAAWRKQAIQYVGGYSSSTLAEDCDLSIAVQKIGYSIIQDADAIAYTEAPLTIKALTKQRFRWFFGNLQVFWKHKDVVFRPRYGWLGMFVLPTALISVLLPLLFTPTLFIVTIENIANDRLPVLIMYSLVLLCIQLLTAIIGLLLAKEKLSYLWALPVAKLVYSPIKTYLLYASVMTFFRGAQVGWNKLVRTNTMNYDELSLRRQAMPAVTMKLGEVPAVISEFPRRFT